MARRRAKQQAKTLLSLQKQIRAAQLRVMGLSQEEIAARLGVSHQMVSKYLLQEEERSRLRIQACKDEIRRQQIERCELTQRLAFQGFERSLRDETEESQTTGGQSGDTITVKRRGQSGNPSYLGQVIKASERVAKFMGLDEPPKMRDQSPDEELGSLPVMEVEVLLPAQADELRDHTVVEVTANDIRPISAEKVDPGPEEVRPADKPHKGVRRRKRSRKD